MIALECKAEKQQREQKKEPNSWFLIVGNSW